MALSQVAVSVNEPMLGLSLSCIARRLADSACALITALRCRSTICSRGAPAIAAASASAMWVKPSEPRTSRRNVAASVRTRSNSRGAAAASLPAAVDAYSLEASRPRSAASADSAAELECP
eukprot:6201335-Pleurochrysis_carterae.AAC.5